MKLLEQMKLLEAALAYAQMGWNVFPLKPGQKRPATANGLLDATVDRDVINSWWTARRGWEERNVAVVTSRASGIWVLDCDTDKTTGELGEDTLARLISENGELPRCPVQTTPGGGRHYFFAWPDDGRDLPRRIRFETGLDALGSRFEDGKELAGYLVIAPSTRPDGEYKWVVSPDECPPPQAPQWLVDMIRAGKRDRPSDMPVSAPVHGATTPYGRAALSQICAEIASCPPGSQDDTLVRKSTRIGSIQAGGNIEYSEAYNSLVSAALQMSNGDSRDPWTRKTIEKKVQKAMAYGAKDPTVVQSSYDRPVFDERPKPQLIVSNPVKEDQDNGAQPGWINSAKNEWMRAHNWIWKDEENLKPTALRNIQLMVEFHPDLAGMFVYNAFADQIMVMRGLPGDDRDDYPRELTDYDETALATWLSWHGLSPAINTTGSVLREIAFRYAVDPLMDWATALKWDGKKRIDDWLTYYLGVPKTRYSEVVGRKFLISAIARAVEPGCKVDTMLILEGPQGLKKSTAIRVLCGDEWFSDQVGDVTNKDSSQAIQGVWIMEIPEMDKFNRAEANSVKDFLARLFDRYRPPYGKNMVKRDRRTVFFGTINPDGHGYLKDTTGNRRYWPVECVSIDIEGLAADREQIWAEAYHAYKSGEPWWVADDDLKIVETEQEARVSEDPWTHAIKQWLDRDARFLSGGAFTTSQCLKEACGFEVKAMGLREQIRASKILKQAGCRARNNANGIPNRSWEYRPDD